MSNPDNKLFLREVAIVENGVTTELSYKGKSYTFVIAVMASVDEVMSLGKLVESRTMRHKSEGGKLDVVIEPDLITGMENLFPDAKTGKDGKLTIQLKTDASVSTATQLMAALRQPELSWPEAVVFCRVNAPLVSRILKAFAELNGELAEESAKND